MGAKPRKVLIFGLDGPVAPALLRYCREGKLPALARLIDTGVLAPNAMVPLPTATPANWTSIATGTWPGTHGISDYNVRVPGTPLDRAHMAFHSPDVKAEYLWNAIARAGKKSVVVNFVTTWPPVVDNGIQIGGSGCDINQWFHPNLAVENRAPGTAQDAVRLDEEGLGTGAAAPGLFADCAYAGLFCTDVFQPESTTPMRIRTEAPQGWSNLPPATRLLAAELALTPTGGRYAVTGPVWQLLLIDEGRGFERALVCEGKDAAQPMASLCVGDWSAVLRRTLVTERGPMPCAFALKLLALSGDATDVRLYHSPLCALEGWSAPVPVAARIHSERGLPDPDGGFHGYNQGWFGADTLLEAIEMQRQWYADACTHLMKNEPWDLFIMRYHLPDTSWHSLSEVLDPTTARNADERRRHEAIELGIYEACDRLARDLVACIDPSETLQVLISDHGAKPAGHAGIDANAILQQAGLLTRSAEGRIDWSRTHAVSRPVCWVHINLKGRDPDGIVNPGEEYRQAQEAIVSALGDYVDPVSGRKPVLFALRKEDARFLNIYGEQAGDVVYALKHDHGYQHGPFLPTADYQGGSLRGLLAFSGPGVRKGVQIARNVWCIDMVPTICHLAGWPVPRDTEGAVIYQVLEETGA
jgi:hypothetical protein